MNPVSRLNTVVLPAPLGPTRATIAPWRSVNVRSSAAMMPPKRLDRPVTSSTTGAARPQPGPGPLLVAVPGDRLAGRHGRRLLEELVLGPGQLGDARRSPFGTQPSALTISTRPASGCCCRRAQRSEREALGQQALRAQRA